MINTKVKKLIKKSIINKYQNILYKDKDIEYIYLKNNLLKKT